MDSRAKKGKFCSKLPFSFVKIISLVEGRSVCWFLHQSLTLAPNQPREPPPQARPRHYKPSPCSCHRHKSTQLYKFTSLGRYYFGWTQHIERNKHHYWGYLKTYHRPPLRWMFNPRQSRMSTWMNDWLWATNLSWAGLQYASRERGSSAISQNYPPLGNSSLFEENCKGVGVKYWKSTVFNVNIRRVHSLTRKYSESDKISGDREIPISAIEKWRNVATAGRVLYCDERLSRWIESG